MKEVISEAIVSYWKKRSRSQKDSWNVPKSEEHESSNNERQKRKNAVFNGYKLLQNPWR